MHGLFTVFGKLLGIFVLYQGLSTAVGSVLAGRDQGFAWFALGLTGLAFLAGFLLVFRTEWLARAVGVEPEAGPPFGGADPAALLRAGIVLVGLHYLLIRFPWTAETVYRAAAGSFGRGLEDRALRPLIQALPLALAVTMVFRAERIVELVWKAEKRVP